MFRPELGEKRSWESAQSWKVNQPLTVRSVLTWTEVRESSPSPPAGPRLRQTLSGWTWTRRGPAPSSRGSAGTLGSCSQVRGEHHGAAGVLGERSDSHLFFRLASPAASSTGTGRTAAIRQQQMMAWRASLIVRAALRLHLDSFNSLLVVLTQPSRLVLNSAFVHFQTLVLQRSVPDLTG